MTSLRKEMQAELKDAIQSLFEGKPLGITDPPPLAHIPADTELSETRLSKDVAWRIFIGHVAQSIVVEATRAVRWRLRDLEHASLRELFDSRFFARTLAEGRRGALKPRLRVLPVQPRGVDNPSELSFGG